MGFIRGNLKLVSNLLTVTALLVIAPAGAMAEGGNSGGGGNLTTTTFDEASSMAKLALSDVREQFGWLANNLARISDPELRNFIQGMISGEGVASKVDIFEDIAGTNFEWQLLHPCRGTDGDREAAVSENRPKADICFSLPLLSKLPKANLRSTLQTLVAHELAHHYGASETMAKKVEDYFRGWISKPHAAGGAQNVNALAKQQISILLNRLKQGDVRAAQVCAQLGTIMGLRAAYHDIMIALMHGQESMGEDYGVDGEKIKSTDRVYYGSKVMDFCDSKDIGAESISETLRKALIVEMEGLASVTEDLESAAPDRYRPAKAAAAK